MAATVLGSGAVPEPRVEIEYCTQCRWLLRAGWTAQELLTTFPAELGEVALVPGSGGVFDVRVDGETVWSRKGAGGGFRCRGGGRGGGAGGGGGRLPRPARAQAVGARPRGGEPAPGPHRA